MKFFYTCTRSSCCWSVRWILWGWVTFPHSAPVSTESLPPSPAWWTAESPEESFVRPSQLTWIEGRSLVWWRGWGRWCQGQVASEPAWPRISGWILTWEPGPGWARRRLPTLPWTLWEALWRWRRQSHSRPGRPQLGQAERTTNGPLAATQNGFVQVLSLFLRSKFL